MPFAGYDPAGYWLNTNEWSFPVCEVLHIIGFAILIGTINIVDLRLLGLGMRHQTSAELVKDTAPWSLLGLFLVLTTGPLIFFSDPAMYVYNKAFRFKMTMLVIAMLWNWTIHRKIAMQKEPGDFGKFVGMVSILMWVSLIFAGIFIAFI